MLLRITRWDLSFHYIFVKFGFCAQVFYAAELNRPAYVLPTFLSHQTNVSLPSPKQRFVGSTCETRTGVQCVPDFSSEDCNKLPSALLAFEGSTAPFAGTSNL